MQILHGAFSIACRQKFPDGECALNRQFDRVLLVKTRALQDPIGDRLTDILRVSGMSDADTHSPVLTGAELRLNIAQTIVPRMTAAKFKFDVTGVEIKLIVRDENFGRRNGVEIRYGSDALARKVHVLLRLENPYFTRSTTSARNQSAEFFVAGKTATDFMRHILREPKPCVMPGAFVFRSGIAQSDDEFDR